MESSILLKVQEKEKMEGTMISNSTQSLSPTSEPWKVYHNPIYSQHPDPSISTAFSSPLSNLTFSTETTTKSVNTELEDAKAQIIDLIAELEFERSLRERMEHHTKCISNELEKEKRLREAAERVNDELGIQALGHEAEIGSIRRAIDEEKKMMRVAEVFREGKVDMKIPDAKIFIQENQEKPFHEKVRRTQTETYGGRGGGFVSPISVRRRSASPEPENPHIKRGIKGSVEFQRVVKAMCSNKSNSKHLGGNYKLEGQKAQLKILLKQRSPVRPNSFFVS